MSTTGPFTTTLEVGDPDLIKIHGLTDLTPFAAEDIDYDDDDNPVLVIMVSPSEDEQPYLDALAAAGFTRVGTDASTGDWLVTR